MMGENTYSRWDPMKKSSDQIPAVLFFGDQTAISQYGFFEGFLPTNQVYI